MKVRTNMKLNDSYKGWQVGDAWAYGWFSEKQARIAGTCIYLQWSTEKRDWVEVEVSEVTRENRPCGNFSDMKALGPILSLKAGGWVRDGRKGWFDSYTPNDLTF